MPVAVEWQTAKTRFDSKESCSWCRKRMKFCLFAIVFVCLHARTRSPCCRGNSDSKCRNAVQSRVLMASIKILSRASCAKCFSHSEVRDVFVEKFAMNFSKSFDSGICILLSRRQQRPNPGESPPNISSVINNSKKDFGASK